MTETIPPLVYQPQNIKEAGGGGRINGESNKLSASLDYSCGRNLQGPPVDTHLIRALIFSPYQRRRSPEHVRASHHTSHETQLCQIYQAALQSNNLKAIIKWLWFLFLTY